MIEKDNLLLEEMALDAKMEQVNNELDRIVYEQKQKNREKACIAYGKAIGIMSMERDLSSDAHKTLLKAINDLAFYTGILKQDWPMFKEKE